jgi:hypothetical protein
VRQLGVRKRVSDRSGKPEVFGLCADGLVTPALPVGRDSRWRLAGPQKKNEKIATLKISHNKKS